MGRSRNRKRTIRMFAFQNLESMVNIIVKARAVHAIGHRSPLSGDMGLNGHQKDRNKRSYEDKATMHHC